MVLNLVVLKWIGPTNLRSRIVTGRGVVQACRTNNGSGPW